MKVIVSQRLAASSLQALLLAWIRRHGILQPIRGVPAAYRMRSGTDDLMLEAQSPVKVFIAESPCEAFD